MSICDVLLKLWQDRERVLSQKIMMESDPERKIELLEKQIHALKSIKDITLLEKQVVEELTC